MNNINTQKGFTLIELMIAVVIGLIITAAAAQVYVMGVRNASIQKAASGVLDANVFGLQQIEKNVRMAGLGLGMSTNLNRDCSGLVISTNNNNRFNCSDGSPASDATNSDIYTIKLEGITGGVGLAHDMRTLAAKGPSNTSNTDTPQLTIQFRAPVDMRDCEGRLALGPRQVNGWQHGRKLDDNSAKINVDGQVIIERYFVHRNTEGQLELRCDAGRYVLEHITNEADLPRILTPDQQQAYQAAAIVGENSPVRGMGADDALIISGIDDFQVRLGVKGASGIRYATIAQYEQGEVAGEVVAVKMAILAKGNFPIPQNDAVANPEYKIFENDNVTMATGQPTNSIRRVYESTVMLRNSRGSN